MDMKKTLAVFALAAVLALALAAPAFAATGAGGAGRDFGQHHAAHAQEMGGFTGTDNPGVMHKGFSGWTGM
jgi:opacity protein-like surface antigen